MKNSELSTLPREFKYVRAQRLDGYRVSERLGDPVIVIEKNQDGYRAKLFGRRKIKGDFRYGEALSLNHNWYIDEDTIRPLPNDIVDAISSTFTEFDLQKLSFPDVLALKRLSQNLIEIELDDDVLTPAKLQATRFTKPGSISGLVASLFPYQAAGVAWMHSTLSHTGGLILADEMGLGKTIQIISLLLLSPPTNDAPALILCPTSLISNWRREIFKFAPELSVLVHRGPNRAGRYQNLQIAQVVLTTYDTAVNDISILSAFEWSWLICDEAQAIKNPDSQRRIALTSIPRRRCIPMTGTPVENSLVDLWSIADFAIPGLLGSRIEFEVEFPDGEQSARMLKRSTEPIVLRRRVEDVAGDLPERIDVDIPIEMNAPMAAEYEKVREMALDKYPVAGALVATGQLQMFCAHPKLQATKFDAPLWEDKAALVGLVRSEIQPPKLELTVDLVREAFSNDRKVLIFSVFNRCGDLIKDALAPGAHVFWEAINGSTPQLERQSIVDGFTNHDGPGCLVLNPKAAGSGLNITAATVVIHYTQVWNPALEAQASARAHRRGQTEPVTIYRLFYENTVEAVMIERSQWKRDLGNEAIPIATRDHKDLKRALSISPDSKNV
nr:DEAD/DEAH box helicase [uncultured Roseibium sp.]